MYACTIIMIIMIMNNNIYIYIYMFVYMYMCIYIYIYTHIGHPPLVSDRETLSRWTGRIIISTTTYY